MTPEQTTTTWRRSSYSGSNGGNCVEVAFAASQVGVRDSKCRDAGQLAVPDAAWEHFLAAVRR